VRNLEIKQNNDAALLLTERAVSRIAFGVGGLLFAVLIFTRVPLPQTDHFQLAVWGAYLLGAVSVLVAITSAIFPGYLKLDQLRRELSILIGPRKLIFKPLVVPYSEIEALYVKERIIMSSGGGGTVIMSSGGGGTVTYQLLVDVRDRRTRLILDENKDRKFIVELGQEVAKRIGCELQEWKPFHERNFE